MLHLFTGTDSHKAREELNRFAKKAANGADTVRITDAHALPDLEAALSGGGMFGGERVVVLDSVLSREDMRAIVLRRLPELKAHADVVVLYESAPDAATRKQLEKHAATSKRFDAVKSAKQETIFGLVRHLQAGKKKDLWVAYQREIARGKAPEAIHGMLFFAAKDALLRNPKDALARARLAALAALPHDARRSGFELEYALERFILS